MDNKEKIDQLFKGVIERYELRPSSDVWNRIENELNDTQKTPVSIPYLRYAAMLLLFITISVISVPTGNHPFEIASVAEDQPVVSNTFVAATDLNVATPVVTAEVITNSTQSVARPEEISPIASLNPLKASAIKLNDQEDDFILVPEEYDEVAMADGDNNALISRIFNSDRSIDAMGFDGFTSEENNSELTVKSHTPNLKYLDLDMRGFYFGVSGSYNQTSILDYGNVIKDGRSIQASLKFGAAKSLVFGYNFSNKFGIQAEYVYNSIQGQNYVTSEDDEIIQKTLSLNYDQIPVTARIKVGKISDITNKPIILNYTAGVQYGILREYRLPQDKRYESTDNLFKDNDLSLVLGLEYEIYLQDNLNVSIGARGTISNDISLHDATLDDFAKRNFVFGLRAGVNYAFR